MKIPLLLAAWFVLSACQRNDVSHGTGDTGAVVQEEDSGTEPNSDPDSDSEVPHTALESPYPVVLTHGFAGFTNFGGLGLLDYFYEVPEYLESEGELLVFATQVDPFNDSVTRGEQLIPQIEAILAETGHSKVNLIGHSQGGIDARYVASVRPDLVSSVTTISTPHRGTVVADVVLGIEEDSAYAQVLDWWVTELAGPLYDAVGSETSFYRSLAQLSVPGSEAFTTAHPYQPDVAYFSLAGRSDFHLGGTDCWVDDPPEFVSNYALGTDPIDPIFALTEPLLDGGLFAPHPNDGLVTVKSAQWGTFLGCIPADHTDEVGQIAGDLPGLTNVWRHKPFYADLVAFLRANGH